MKVGLALVYSHAACTLKDVAGGFGTRFAVGSSRRAQLLERAKVHLAELPPVAMGHLAAQLHAAGHAVSTHRLDAQAGLPALPTLDAVFVQTSMVDGPAEAEVLRAFRARGTRAFATGAFASAKPHLFADAADVVVRGEAEALGAALLDAPDGVIDAGSVDDLDSLPFPDWSAFPIARYRYALLTRRGPTLPITSARGCAYGCGYCPWRVTARFRERDPDRVVAEARHLMQRFGARGLSFRDPLFNLDAERVRRIARGLAPLGARWSAEMRADRLDDGLLRELAGAGMRSLEIGVESVNRDMLSRQHRKPPERAQIARVVKTAQRLGVRVICNYVLGLPDDDEETIRATVRWARELDSFAVQFTVATPYPGTSLEPEEPKANSLRAYRAYSGFNTTPDTTSRLDPARLESLREWAYVSYHFRPRYALRFARHAVPALLD